MSGATPITLITSLTHIYLGDERIATFQSQTDDTPKTSDDDKLIFHLSDHLNSSSLDLSITGSLLQATDYLPFGKSNTYEVTTKRVKGKKGGYTNKYKFANKQEDLESDLQYFEKRYYDNRIGRFTTEDPVYWEVAFTKRPNQYFTDPQQWNSYSYVRNNPINLVDPTGELSNPGQQFMDTLWQLYDAGAKNIMNDVKSEVKAYQQAGVTLAQNLPGTADVGDAYAFATGKDAYSGEDVSGINRALAGVATFIPGVSGGELRTGSNVVQSSGLVNKLNHIFGKTSHNMTALLDKFGGNQQKALNATTNVANQALKDGKLQIGKNGVLPKVGTILNVNGVQVQMIGGKVVDGKVIISSLSRSGLK